MGRMSVDEFKAAEKTPLTVVLDDVRSMYNVGSCCARATLPREGSAAVRHHGRPTPPRNTQDGARSGGQRRLAPLHVGAGGRPRTAGRGRKGDGRGAMRGQHDAGRLPSCPGAEYAVVLGNEVKGVSQAVVDACDGCLEIPQYGTKHSLNVSVTAGIVIYSLNEKLRMNNE